MNPSLIHLHPNQTLPYTETGYYKTCYLNNENIYDKQIKSGRLWKENWLYLALWLILLVWGVIELFF